MFCFSIFIVLYGLSLTEAYNIKVTGNVELGNQFSQMFRGALASLNKISFPTDDSFHIQIPTVEQPTTPQNVTNGTVIENMKKAEQHNVHLYGNHKKHENATPNPGAEPLNNINA